MSLKYDAKGLVVVPVAAVKAWARYASVLKLTGLYHEPRVSTFEETVKAPRAS